MAQLIKLHNYASHYEADLSQYPSQFIRMKREQWKGLKEGLLQENQEDSSAEQTQKINRFFRLPEWLGKGTEKSEDPAEQLPAQLESEVPASAFQPEFVYKPNSTDELKKMFKDQLFHFQLKCASSTSSSKSAISSKYYRDPMLRHLVQNLPDNYFLLYHPVVQLNNAPIELDIILISPTACYCITALEEEEGAVYEGRAERFWTKKVQNKQTKMLNPFIALNRMEAVVSNLLAKGESKLQVNKVLFSRKGFFIEQGPVHGIELIGKNSADQWIEQLAAVQTPFKRQQFQAAETLLLAASPVTRSSSAAVHEMQ